MLYVLLIGTLMYADYFRRARRIDRRNLRGVGLASAFRR